MVKGVLGMGGDLMGFVAFIYLECVNRIGWGIGK